MIDDSRHYISGTFRAGRMLNGLATSLEEWRVTTGDPEVADRIHELFGGDAPQEWETKGEENLEVFTTATTVDVIVSSAKALRQRIVAMHEGPIAAVSVELDFRLASAPNLGTFQFRSSSWRFARILASDDIEHKLEELDGPAAMTLCLVPGALRARRGPRAGQTVRFVDTFLKFREPAIIEA